ncbi:hypothetical protein CR513_02086, partial [Mucuna pruriens]
MVRRLMSSKVGEEAKTQRENIFHSRCLMKGNLCSIIIDGGSRVNLAFATFAYPRPYKLQWLSERGMLLVDRKMEVTFTLGSYKDKVVFYVVLIEATHLLLERPWQYDKTMIHNEVTNRFTFVHLGQRVVLKPLSPREINEDQNKMRVKKERERKIERKKKKEVSERNVEKRKEKRGENGPLGQEETLVCIDTLLHVSHSLMFLPTSVEELLEEFKDVFPKDVPHGLPPLRGIKHHLDLTLGAI